ncbi:hypothetical protein ER308_16660 [Egibacter rhizosphaerae]|uniref:Uncharacterized protein n=1 Tax=Egibacter rhizosphaerae TaxID=1670831 RepID=A0A411YIY8_9ACTN|nr:hypothetical protein [Egibacter rhizosphaerae]QBI21042.1 hypothetical protein ER308_16660 [Egibacter rhizosphaerae]
MPMLLLAQGLERLLKLTYVVATIHRTGAAPQPSELKPRSGISHDLHKAIDYVAAISEPHASRLLEQRDEPVTRLLLKLLSAAALRDRYHFLDLLTGDQRRHPADDDPNRRWESELERAVIDARPEVRDALLSGDPQRRERAHQAVSADISMRVGELLGAVHHLWANRDVVGADATKHATTIRTYGHLGAQQQQLWAPIAL